VFSRIFEEDGKEYKGREKVLHVECLREGEILDYVDKGGEMLHLANGPLHVSINLVRGGAITILDRPSGEVIVKGPQCDALGPPFSSSEFDKARCQFSVRRGAGSVTVLLEMSSEMHKGVSLLKEVTVRTGSPLLAIRYGLTNREKASKVFEVKTKSTSGLPKAKVYLPTRWGLFCEETSGNYPASVGDAPRKPGDFAEKWMAYEGTYPRLLTVGTIWSEVDREVEIGESSLAIPGIELKAEPRGTAMGPTFYLYASDGNWIGLREAYARLTGKPPLRVSRALDIRTRRPLEVRMAGGFFGPSQPPVEGWIDISNMRAKTESGQVAIEPPADGELSLILSHSRT